MWILVKAFLMQGLLLAASCLSLPLSAIPRWYSGWREALREWIVLLKRTKWPDLALSQTSWSIAKIDNQDHKLPLVPHCNASLIKMVFIYNCFYNSLLKYIPVYQPNVWYCFSVCLYCLYSIDNNNNFLVASQVLRAFDENKDFRGAFFNKFR